MLCTACSSLICSSIRFRSHSSLRRQNSACFFGFCFSPQRLRKLFCVRSFRSYPYFLAQSLPMVLHIGALRCFQHASKCFLSHLSLRPQNSECFFDFRFSPSVWESFSAFVHFRAFHVFDLRASQRFFISRPLGAFRTGAHNYVHVFCMKLLLLSMNPL